MYDLSFNIFCLVGIIYLLWRIIILFRSLLLLFLKSKSWDNKSTKEKISELCHCNFSIFDNINF